MRVDGGGSRWGLAGRRRRLRAGLWLLHLGRLHLPERDERQGLRQAVTDGRTLSVRQRGTAPATSPATPWGCPLQHGESTWGAGLGLTCSGLGLTCSAWASHAKAWASHAQPWASQMHAHAVGGESRWHLSLGGRLMSARGCVYVCICARLSMCVYMHIGVKRVGGCACEQARVCVCHWLVRCKLMCASFPVLGTLDVHALKVRVCRLWHTNTHRLLTPDPSSGADSFKMQHRKQHPGQEGGT